MPHIFRTQFLYVLVKEINRSDNEYRPKIDTRLRVVYWQSQSKHGKGQFVVYGTRPESLVSGKFNPYRLTFQNLGQVARFAKTVISPDHDVALELHQFDGLNDDSEDPLNVDWDNTAENGSSELVAFDFYSIKKSDGTYMIPFRQKLANLLRILEFTDAI